MASETILVVEDDKHISALVKYNLEKSGYTCLTAFAGEQAFEILSKEKIDLVVLDLMLPKMDGFEVCRNVRREEKLKYIPIVMLTAKGEESDRVVGLELGADDYMVKPFSPRELILRIRAILRRSQNKAAQKNFLRAGELTVDVSRHRAAVGEKKIELTPMEFKLLATLMQKEGVVQTRKALLSDIWDIHSKAETRTVDTHVKRLREKLGKAGEMIETVVGIGYRFEATRDED